MTAESIGVQIRRAREMERWTQRQLADRLGVDRKTVDNWENGRSRPRSSIGAIEQVLGISLTEGARPATELAEREERLTAELDYLSRRFEQVTAELAEVRRVRRGTHHGGRPDTAPGPRPAGRDGISASETGT